MSQAKWEKEREELLERLREKERIALESQAEAAVYLDLLKNCNEAASLARDSGNVTHLNSIKGNLMFYATPRKEDEWGKYFLNAYMRDAGWLEDAKKALEQIKAEAAKILEDSKTDAEMRKIFEKISALADNGLIEHI